MAWSVDTVPIWAPSSGSDYALDHLGTLQAPAVQFAKKVDPIDLYVRHAERLKKAGL